MKKCVSALLFMTVLTLICNLICSQTIQRETLIALKP